MIKNVGGIDRAIRIILGIAIIAAGVFYENLWGAVGIIPLMTGFIRWCPGYLPFGIKTCKTE